MQLRLGALLQPPRNDIIRTHPRPASPHKPHSRERFGTCPSRTAPTSGLGSGFGQHRKTKFTHPKYRSPTFRSMSDILNKTAFLFRHKRKKKSRICGTICYLCSLQNVLHSISDHSQAMAPSARPSHDLVVTCTISYRNPHLQPRAQVDMDSLLVCVGLKSGFTELSPNAGLLHTSKGNSDVRIVA